MLNATLEPRDSPVQHKKKYANQHWPTEHPNKQPSVIFKVTTIITPTVAIDNQTAWIAFQNVHAAQATVPISQIRHQFFMRGVPGACSQTEPELLVDCTVKQGSAE